MTKNDRVVPPLMHFPTHEEGLKRCLVMTSTAVHTATLPSGASFAALVINAPQHPCGAAVLMDRAETEAMIALLQNALDDADRLNAGKRPLARREKGSLQ
ncbi:hypothetical protein GR702_13315 [Novosphingobium sp. FGD1]|uniref:Uncharacterized protein n=1 Tax=Novosphingobium silvae TaxID=2692619 RepID=A0A7X4GHH2_9SPHN|nr:hypothetical protein [Novosphingobium silvae]MYL98743.1 hypothetical protein [Novosphingobium silvae]